MLRNILRRYNAIVLTGLSMVFSIPVALLLAYMLDMALKGYVPTVDLIITITITSILGSAMCYALFVMIKKLDEAEAQLRALAHLDGLTGLCNRRHFEELVADEVLRANRYGTPLAVVMVDIDHFKNVNDNHGHAAGDIVIKGIASELHRALRSLDTVSRYGGEEFVCLLPQTTQEEATLLAERMRHGVSVLEIRVDGVPPLHLTASFGVAGLRPGETDIATLMQRADTSMYEAKRGGRDRVCGAMA